MEYWDVCEDNNKDDDFYMKDRIYIGLNLWIFENFR